MPVEPSSDSSAVGLPWHRANEHPPQRLTAGEVLSDRFVIQRLAGSGGMGAVYEARDRISGASVAVKVMTRQGMHEARFAQEARVLAELRHPAIVRYVAHGQTAERQPYLAMDWLRGEDLAQRLARSRLTVAESLEVARRVAGGLAAAHGRGVVHRDVKPSNVRLVDGEAARATLLDFGIARTELSGAEPTMGPNTATGVVLGTVGYMSPEQATGEALDARTDLFALGCVLFQCLTGEPAFAGAHMVAVLAKVLRAEAPRVRTLRPELPERLDDLVARMLAKDRAARVPDAGAVLRELVAIGTVAGGTPPEVMRPSVGMSHGERRMVTVMLARLEGFPHAATNATLRPAGTLAEEWSVPDRASRHGGEAVRLTDGTVLVTFAGGGATAMEHAGRAASYAHDLRSMHPSATVAVATGFAQTAERPPFGEAIDRAAALLSGQSHARTALDPVTASLVETRFELGEESGVRVLGSPRLDDEEARTLLGKRTPCVGRDHELAMLRTLLDQCMDERSPRAVLVTAPPGTGKSRLRQEFLARLSDTGGCRIVFARADVMSAGSAFVLARQVVQRLGRLDAVDPWDVQHAKLRTRLVDRIGPKDAGLVAEFMCELLGVPVQSGASPILRAARGDPRLLANWLRRSFEDWLVIEARDPLLVVLEDLHWGDAPSVSYLGRVLKEHSLPLMVLGLARPEVRDVFPNLWSGVLHEVSLGGLGKRAAEQLVRAVLDDPDDDAVAAVVERADGNAFYLEELIRSLAEGRGDALPETVMAMAHARLERLEPPVRRVLRAASVLGDRFWVSGLATILGSGLTAPAESDEASASTLAALEEQELILPSRTSRFPGEREFMFRHTLVRDAGYATLTDADLMAAHRLAADWLERVGESDPLIMTDHLEKGGESERAVPWLIRAAAAAYDGGSAIAAMKLAERGVAYATGADRGMLRAIQGVSAGAQMELERALPALREAMTLLPKGGRYWFISACNLSFFGALAGNPSATAELADAIADLPSIVTRGGLYAWSAARVVLARTYGGQPEQATAFLQQLERAATTHTEKEPSFMGWLALARVHLSFYSREEDYAAIVRNARMAVAIFEETRDCLAVVSARLWEACAVTLLGRNDQLREAAERGLAFAQQSGHPLMGRHLEAIRWAGIAIPGSPAQSLTPLMRLAQDPLPSLAVTAALILVRALLLAGDAAGAEMVARDALERAHGTVPLEAGAHAALARVLLVRGRPHDSLAAADRAYALPVIHPYGFDELGLTRAQALQVLGRIEDARVAIRRARDRVLRIAATLNAEDRASYLNNVDANVRTLALAKAWLGE